MAPHCGDEVDSSLSNLIGVLSSKSLKGWSHSCRSMVNSFVKNWEHCKEIRLSWLYPTMLLPSFSDLDLCLMPFMVLSSET